MYGGATQTTLQQRALEGEYLAQQARDLSERLTEHDGFRRSLEEKLQQARDALEHYRAVSKKQRGQDAVGTSSRSSSFRPNCAKPTSC
ncbi:hypothetical protein [Cupriavidus sp. 8B]